MRSLSVILAALLGIAGCAASNNNPTPTSPPPTAATTEALKSIEAIVNVEGSGCKPGDCWLPLYPQSDTTQSTPLNLGREASTGCTAASTGGCKPQPADKVSVVCMEINNGQIWFGVEIPDDNVLSPDQPIQKAPTGKTLGFNRAQWFRLRGLTFPQPC